MLIFKHSCSKISGYFTKEPFFAKKTSVDVTNTREWVFYTAAQTLAFNIILFQFCLPFSRTTYFSCFCMVSPNSFAAVKLIFIQVLFEKQQFRKGLGVAAAGLGKWCELALGISDAIK